MHSATVSAAASLRRSSRLLAVSRSNFETKLESQQHMSTNIRQPSKCKRVAEVPIESMPPKAKKKRKRTDAMESHASTENLLRQKRKGGPKPEAVFVIPDVEKQETSFRGRLGRFSFINFNFF